MLLCVDFQFAFTSQIVTQPITELILCFEIIYDCMRATSPFPTQSILEVTCGYKGMKSDCGFMSCSESGKPENSCLPLESPVKKLAKTKVPRSFLISLLLLCSLHREDGFAQDQSTP